MHGLPATLIPFGESFVAITLLSESGFILCCNNVPFTEREQRYRHTGCSGQLPNSVIATQDAPGKLPSSVIATQGCTSTR